MSKRFHVDPNERVDVYEFEPTGEQGATPPNVITIRARMNVEIAGRVKDEMDMRKIDPAVQGMTGSVGVALLLHNILAWSGPDFDDLPCTPENIAALPPPQLDPFIEKVVNVIGERNAKRESPNGRSPIAPGFATNGSPGVSPASAVAISHPSEISILKSPLLRALDGHQNRSGD